MIKYKLHIIFNIFFLEFPQQSSYNNCFLSESTNLCSDDTEKFWK